MTSGTDSQPTARRRRLPFRTYVMLALVAVTVISLVWARAVGSRARALNAENKAKIQWVTGYLAATATTDAGRARSALLRQNLGSAQDALRRAEEAMDALDQIASEANRDAVTAGREALERAQEALRQGKETDAQKAMDDITRALGPLVVE